MLSENNYNALVKFRDGPVKVSAKQMTDEMYYFKEMEYITSCATEVYSDADEYFIITTAYKLTPRGDDALSEYEQVMRNHSEEKAQQKKNRIFEIFLILLGAAIGYAVDHVSNIISWFVSLF